MKIEQVLYWAAYTIPFVLILVGASAQKLVEKSEWHWKHFYCGMDLTLAVLGAALVNILDLAKETVADKRTEGLGWTAIFVAASVVFLLIVSGFHQDWESEEKFGRGQIVFLFYVSNGMGLALAYGFVQLKVKGLL